MREMAFKIREKLQKWGLLITKSWFFLMYLIFDRKLEKEQTKKV